MRKMLMLLTIIACAASVSRAITGTLRNWSADRNTLVSTDGGTTWYWAPATSSVAWWLSPWTPPHWGKIGDDGAVWISWHIDGDSGLRRLYYYRVRVGFSVAEPTYYSRITLWLACDDWDSIFTIQDGVRRLVAVHPWVGHGNYVDSLYRVDLTDFVQSRIRPFIVEIAVVDQFLFKTGIIYYISADYGPIYTYRPLSGIASHSGWWTVSLPIRIDGVMTLRSLYQNTLLYAYILNPSTQSWQSLNIDRPIQGAFADTLRTFSIVGFFDFSSTSPEVPKVSGIPIFEQRYLDLKPCQWAGAGNKWYPIGSVQCIIPFNCAIGEPDDLPDFAFNDLQGYNGSEVPAPEIQIRPFDGYIASINRPIYPQTGHLDLRCFPRDFAGENAMVPMDEYRELFPDQIFIDNYPPHIEVDIADTGITEASDSETGSSEEEGGYVPPLNPLPPLPHIPEFHRQATGMHNSVLPPILANFPNPFNVCTTIMYRIFGDSEQHVDINVYDIHGKRIATILSETQEPGNYFIAWDATDDSGQRLGTGIYLIHICSFSGTYVNKVFLMR